LLKIGRLRGQRTIELFAYFSGTGVRIEAASANGAKIFRHQFNGGIGYATDFTRWRIQQRKRWKFRVAHDWQSIRQKSARISQISSGCSTQNCGVRM